MQTQSDTQIRASLRMVMARHGIDPNQTSFICTKGIVRLQGELRHHGPRAGADVKGDEVEALEQEIKHVRGVVRVHFDIRDWHRDASGAWSRRGEGRSTRSITRDIVSETTSALCGL